MLDFGLSIVRNPVDAASSESTALPICTPELLDVLKERVWRELEEENECGRKTIAVPGRI